jgi:hypothetical protein
MSLFPSFLSTQFFLRTRSLLTHTHGKYKICLDHFFLPTQTVEISSNLISKLMHGLSHNKPLSFFFHGRNSGLFYYSTGGANEASEIRNSDVCNTPFNPWHIERIKSPTQKQRQEYERLSPVLHIKIMGMDF